MLARLMSPVNDMGDIAAAVLCRTGRGRPLVDLAEFDLDLLHELFGIFDGQPDEQVGVCSYQRFHLCYDRSIDVIVDLRRVLGVAGLARWVVSAELASGAVAAVFSSGFAAESASGAATGSVGAFCPAGFASTGSVLTVFRILRWLARSVCSAPGVPSTTSPRRWPAEMAVVMSDKIA
jgi:hypothetical protein